MEGEKKMKIVIVGCTGRIGGHLLKSLLEKGHEVLAIARHPERIKVKNDNLQIKNVNLFDENVMAEELQGKDALVSCLGGSGSFLNRKPVSIYTNSAEVFAAAMRRSGVSRLIIFSAWHMAEENRPLWVKAFVPMGFRNPMKNLADMEKYLVETCADLDYTAVKACFGKGQNETGKPILAAEGQCVPGASWFITYGDLSKFIIENCLQGGEWKKKLVSVTGS